MSFAMKTYQKSNLKTIWCYSDCIIWKYLEFQIVSFETSQTRWTVAFLAPKVWMNCGVFNAFFVDWTVENVSFECSYSLGLKDINILHASIISFILHFPSFLIFS